MKPDKAEWIYQGRRGRAIFWVLGIRRVSSFDTTALVERLGNGSWRWAVFHEFPGQGIEPSCKYAKEAAENELKVRQEYDALMRRCNEKA